MEKLKIGKVANTFGLKGELKVLSDSEFVEQRFKVGNIIYLNETIKVQITSYRKHNEVVLIKIDNLDDISLVEKYKNMDIYFNKKDIEPLDGDYYLFQLENLDVYVDDKKVGKVIEVTKPAQTLLKIAFEDREILLPFVDAFIKNVDLKNNRVDITLIEGF